MLPHRHRIRLGLLAVLGAGALLLAACQRTPAPPPKPDNATPEEAISTNLALVAVGDFDGLMQNRLPPADYATWRREWQQARAQQPPVSQAQQDQFARIMHMLTAKDAEATLAPRLKAQLGDASGRAIMTGLIETSARQMITASPQLGPDQRVLATTLLDTLAAWARTNDFSKPRQAKAAIAIACDTARQLHVATLAQWRALDYPTTMRNYGIIWTGLEKILAVYGVDLARSFNDAKVKTLAQDGSAASIQLTLKLAGQTLTGTWSMQRQQDHWYDAAMLDAWNKAHPASVASVAAPPTHPPVVPAAAGSAAPVPAGTAPATPAAAPASAQP